jgi:Ca2+-dependent lipid-binding protein
MLAFFHCQNMIFDKNYGSKNSSKKKDEMNPVYHETFTWEIPDTEGTNNLVLTCKVMDDDMLFDDKIGMCKINLEELALSAEPIGVDRVVDNNWFCKDARIYLSISYS